MGLSFLRGMAAAVNPCGFILLPTYLMYFLGLEGQHPGSQRATIRRGLVVSGAVSSPGAAGRAGCRYQIFRRSLPAAQTSRLSNPR